MVNDSRRGSKLSVAGVRRRGKENGDSELPPAAVAAEKDRGSIREEERKLTKLRQEGMELQGPMSCRRSRRESAGIGDDAADV